MCVLLYAIIYTHSSIYVIVDVDTLCVYNNIYIFIHIGIRCCMYLHSFNDHPVTKYLVL